MSSSNQHSVIVVGAGVSGLGAALALKQRGVDVLLLEEKSHPGGAAQSFRRDGYLCESGPNTLMLSKPEAIQCLTEAGLMESALEAGLIAWNRFVVQNGKLVALPLSPPSFLRSGILSWRAKLRILAEPFIPRGMDESEMLADFVRRRLGPEVLDELIGPFVSGVYAGDPEKLCLRHAFPKLHALERTHGSLIRGAIRLRRGAAPKGRLISWPNGLAQMASALAAPMGNAVRYSMAIQCIHRKAESWIVECRDASFEAETVILATGALDAARLMGPISSRKFPLESLPYAPIVVAHLGWARDSVLHPLDGFGMLISRKRKIRTLGCLFSSSLFPGRAPEGHVLLTAFMGGSLDPDALLLDDMSVVQIIFNDLSPLLGIASPPVFRSVIRWRNAIPQYGADYGRVLEYCDEIESRLPGLHLIGNYRGGISMEDCLANGYRLGRRLAPTCGR